jgi:WXG100 family type VII secretion target
MLLWIAYAIFNAAMVRLGQQIQKMNEIMENAKKTADGLKSDWTGNDYDAFDAYVKNNLMPGMNQAISTMTDWQSRLGRAQDRMRQADTAGKQVASGLADVFGKITSS